MKNKIDALNYLKNMQMVETLQSFNCYNQILGIRLSKRIRINHFNYR